MSTITHLYDVGQTVYGFESNTLYSGKVLRVNAVVSSSGTVITYDLNVNNTAKNVEESLLYAYCRADGGFQDVVFTSALSTTTVVIPAGSSLSLLTGSVIVDGGAPVALSYTVPTAGSPLTVTAVTVQDILNDLNTTLNPMATASIVNNSIRIKSASTGASSTIAITDGGAGSPVNLYFGVLTNFSGLSASTAGNGAGAIEALGQSICS
jgi:hypothetical protein